MLSAWFRHVLADHRAAVEHIQHSGLIWTIVRPPGLTDRPLTGRYRESEDGVPPKSMSIPRAEVAHFILKALRDSRYHNKSVRIAT
mgnify:CR=1 FL=1